MSYRPITDVWILARSKVKFFGAYPAGFLQRARDLLGCDLEDRVLHVCSGRVKEYPYKGFGPNDITMDIDPELAPDLPYDAKQEIAWNAVKLDYDNIRAVLADPPYLPEFADKYKAGRDFFVTGAEIVKHSINVLPLGGRVGILSLHWPRYPKKTFRQVAVIAVYIGNGNLGRTFAVYERIA